MKVDENLGGRGKENERLHGKEAYEGKGSRTEQWRRRSEI